MRNILIIMCLFFTATSWADDEEFPIELTCELGNLIVYYNITDNPETTWWQNHSSNRWSGLGASSVGYTINKDKNRASEVKKRKQRHEITDDYFLFRTEAKSRNITIEYSRINRKTGKATLLIISGGSIHNDWMYNGHCTKGFKNYEKNVF